MEYPITGGTVLIDEEDLALVSGFSWRVVRMKSGHMYAQASKYAGRVNGKKRVRTIRMHRLLMGLGAGDPRVVDHRNGNGLDNRRSSNLRIATEGQNVVNKDLKRKGAFRVGNRFMSRISWNGKRYYLGCFGTEEEAQAAYREAARRLHGEFTRV